MTALVGGTVERTLSDVRQIKDWTSGAEPHEAGGQDFGDLVQAFGGRHVIGMKGVGQERALR